MATHVLVPIDGSEPSWKAFDHVLSHHEGGRITALHVVDPVDTTTGLFRDAGDEGLFGSDEDGFFGSESRKRAEDAGEKLIEEVRQRFTAADLDNATLETAIEPGEPARTIVDFADDNDVDEIAIGSHGREGVSRVLLGSVAENVVRRAGVPVTVVR